MSRRRSRPPASGALSKMRVLVDLEDIDAVVGCYSDPPDEVVHALDLLWQAMNRWSPPDWVEAQPESDR